MGFVKSKPGVAAPQIGSTRMRDFHATDFAKEARAVLDDAIEKGARIEREAYEAGFRQGEQAGIRLGQQQMAPLFDQIQRLVEDLTHARRDLLLRMERDIVALAVHIAEKVVQRTVAEDSTIVRDAVRTAIDESVDRGELVVHVSPDDFEAIEQMRSEVLRMEGVDSVHVVSDPNVDSGGCFIETSSGDIDATLGRAFREIRGLLD